MQAYIAFKPSTSWKVLKGTQMTLNCVQLKSMPALDLNLLVRKVHKVRIFNKLYIR